MENRIIETITLFQKRNIPDVIISIILSYMNHFKLIEFEIMKTNLKVANISDYSIIITNKIDILDDFKIQNIINLKKIYLRYSENDINLDQDLIDNETNNLSR